TPIRGLAYDSRMVRPGDLFFAIKGVHSDGHAFLKEAVHRGAAAAVVAKEVASVAPVVKVPAVLPAMSKIADAFFERPSERLEVSSHGRQLTGVSTVRRGVRVFTDLAQDHLACAKTIHDCSLARPRLSRRPPPVQAALTPPAEHGQRLALALNSRLPYGLAAG